MSRELNDLLTPAWRNGRAVYRGWLPGEIMAPLQWGKTQLPLTYYIDFDREHQKLAPAVVDGAELWNREIGLDLLRQVDGDGGTPSLVTVTWGGFEISDHHVSDDAAHVCHYGTTGPESALLSFTEAADLFTVFVVAAHEFGHVLGLDDDPTRTNSVMYPTLPDLSAFDELPRMQFVCPSDHDIAVLYNLYK
jgi:hypothetical protein